ncbi:glycerophosphodiester phosphodiesterase family protein [Anaerocolumna aminovalerica]|uniref:glycerophosphodiester phosphodiesterase family protein n=1 Tax=Anaerocolumna aminovalerica TaxID=1527 RepID=UPI00248CD7A1|nr:glycerophosphodiester phosphodiesterase family protein [Anaerocolumna aminovalerica]
MFIYILLVTLIILSILYLIAIAPKLIHRHDFTPWQGRLYAHRGLHQDNSKSPENSMEAFRLAVKHGYGIEIDIQLTKDNIPVVFHDYSLTRVCGINKRVNELTYEELQNIKLYQSQETIPTLQNVLDLVNGQVPLIIEFKVESINTTLCNMAAPILDHYKGLYCIQSFNPLVLQWYRKNRPAVMRGQLASNLIKDKEKGSSFLQFILQNLLFNFITKPDFISYNHIHHYMLSLVICRKLYSTPTFAWTINSQTELNKSKKCFDFFIFEQFIPEQ